MTTLTASHPAPPEVEPDAPPTPRVNPSEASGPGKSNPKAEQFANAIALAVLFACPALIVVHTACVNDPDIWWHLRTGEWILNHHAVPRVDPFSGSLAGKPWQAYSWLFELLTIKLFQWSGPVGIVGYSAGMALAITVATWHLIKRLQSDFAIVALLTLATGFAIGCLFTPRPWLFTILFALLELDILMQARRTGRMRGLVWLPLIFALWANIHIEFIDGLLILGVAFVESIAVRWWTVAETRVRPAWMGGVLLASVGATLVNPYGWRVYSVVFDYGSRLVTTASALNRVTELQAMPFRDAADFLILFLALASAAALAWQRRFPLFETGLLIFGTVVSFRSQRDIWVIAAAAALILASRIPSSQKTVVRAPRFVVAAAVIVAGVAIFAGFRVMRVNNAVLDFEIKKTLPADAVAAIRARGYAGPLYDDYNWGGYLIWSLRMPVCMDGRASFYGDERIDRSVRTWMAEPDWASDSQLMSARLVIGPVKAALTQVLRNDPRFQLAYEDKIAAVFIARKRP